MHVGRDPFQEQAAKPLVRPPRHMPAAESRKAAAP